MDNVFEIIKKAYQALWHVKDYGKTLEIVTPVATMNDMFVSVFVTKRGDDYVVTDGGWIDSGLYECEVNWTVGPFRKIGLYYLESLSISKTEAFGKIFYYKKIHSLELLPNIVFDMANFINAIISNSNIQFVADREERTFRKKARGFLNREFGEETFEYDKPIDDSMTVRFNAIRRADDGLRLINFVSGTTSNYYAGSLSKSILNFQVVNRFVERFRIRRQVTLLDDSNRSVMESSQVQTYYNLLVESRTDSNRVVLWSNHKELTDACA